jgi:hypothetical protein
MALASNIALTTITGQFVDYQGNAIAGQIKFTMSKTLRDAIADQIIVPSTVTKTLDANGSFTVTLPATDDPELSETFTYYVEESFTGGRSYYITLPAVNNTLRTNLILNPSAETNTSLTTIVNGSVSQSFTIYRTGGSAGGASFRYISAGGVGGIVPDRIAVTVGLSYAASGYVRDVDTSVQYRVLVDWYTASTGGTLLSTSTGTAVTPTTTGWTRISVVGTAPTNATHAEIKFFTSTSAVSTKVAYFDSLLFEQTGTVKSYFDGYTTDGLGGSPYWNGVPNLSTSSFPDFGGSIYYTSISPVYAISPTYNTYANAGQWSTLDSTVQNLDLQVDQTNGWFVFYNPAYQSLTFKAYSQYASQNTYATLKAGPVIVQNSDISPYQSTALAYQSAAEASNSSAQVSLASIVTESGSRFEPFFVTGG